MIQSNITVDSTQINSYLSALSAQLPVSMRKVTRMEAASVMKIVASKSRGAKTATIRKQTTERYMGRSTESGAYSLSVNRHKSGGTVWLMDRTSRKFFRVGTWAWKGATFARDGWRLDGVGRLRHRGRVG
jgi:hypothetical protein